MRRGVHLLLGLMLAEPRGAFLAARLAGPRRAFLAPRPCLVLRGGAQLPFSQCSAESSALVFRPARAEAEDPAGLPPPRGRGGGPRGRRGATTGGGKGRRNAHKELCNWFAAGFCKHAHKCASRRVPCCNATHMLDLEDAWNAGQDPAPLPPASAGSPVLLSASSRCAQDVECLVVLDVEGGANDRAGEDEIIELPAVIVNLVTEREEARFHRFIRPSSWDTFLQAEARTSPRLNPQSAAVSFPQALNDLDQWLRKHNLSIGECEGRGRGEDERAGGGEAGLGDSARGGVAEQGRVGESVSGVVRRGQERWADGSGRRFLWATCGDWDLNTVVPRQTFSKYALR
jgi:inhibitor of KinA sporulation pathway (predicted exonuclease)